MDSVEEQVQWGLADIRERYGSPAAALRFHDDNDWYDRGGEFA